MTPESPSNSPSWDLIAAWRFILAMIVLIAHSSLFFEVPSWLSTPVRLLGAYDAVVAFLMISRFSMAASIQREPDRFYTRRFIRIYPVYLCAVLLAFVPGLWIHGVANIHSLYVTESQWGQLLGNLVFAQGVFTHPLPANVPLWTLAIEVWFYCLTPWFSRHPRAAFGLLLLSTALYSLSHVLQVGFFWYLQWFSGLFLFAWAWLGGFFLFRGLKAAGDTLAPVALALGTVYILNPHPHARLGWALPLFTFLLLTYGHKFRFRGATARFLGDLSYPVYAVHMPALFFGHWMLGARGYMLAALMAGVVFLVYGFDLVMRRTLQSWLLAPNRERHG